MIRVAFLFSADPNILNIACLPQREHTPQILAGIDALVFPHI